MSMEILKDPVEVAAWIDSWKDEVVPTFVSTLQKSEIVPRLNGTYTIRPDGIVDVEGGVYLDRMDLEYIPIQFGKVTEDFSIYQCPIESLKGSPSVVGGKVWCIVTNITTLEYCPININVDFICANNLNLITDKFEIGAETIIDVQHVDMVLEERTQKYINYLEHTCPDIRYSNIWLQRVDNELYDQMLPGLVKYATENELDWFSDEVKYIASIVFQTNHRL